MSRTTVRQQIVDYLAPPGVPSVVEFMSACLAHPPKVTTEDTFDLGVMGGSGCVVFVYLPLQSEKRIALGGPHGGRKWREYEVTLLAVMRSAKDKAEDVDADNDAFLDSLVERIQADRNFGTTLGDGQEVLPGMIFQAGEGNDTGGTDIVVDVALPGTIRGQLTQIISTVKITVAEVLDT